MYIRTHLDIWCRVNQLWSYVFTIKHVLLSLYALCCHGRMDGVVMVVVVREKTQVIQWDGNVCVWLYPELYTVPTKFKIFPIDVTDEM